MTAPTIGVLFEQETDGRWCARSSDQQDVFAHGQTREEAREALHAKLFSVGPVEVAAEGDEEHAGVEVKIEI